MNAKNQEYADLRDRLMENQQRRKAEAAQKRAITIIQAQRERDYVEHSGLKFEQSERICCERFLQLYDLLS